MSIDIRIEGKRVTVLGGTGTDECKVFDVPDLAPGAKRLVVITSKMSHQQFSETCAAMINHMGPRCAVVILHPSETIDIYDLKPTEEKP